MKGDGYSTIRCIVMNESKTLNRAGSPFVAAVKVLLANSEPEPMIMCFSCPNNGCRALLPL